METVQETLARHIWRVLGKKKTQHKEWISADTIHKLETRRERKTVLNKSRTRAAKARAQEERTAEDWEVKRSIKKDKRDYIDDLTRQAETAAGQGNLSDLYLVTKKMTGKFQQTDKPVIDKNGNPLTTTKEQLERWAEHFRELLNHPTPVSPQDIPSAETELPISRDKPSKAEIKKAIMTMISGKAAGPDEIPAEAIKADLETAVNILYSLFSKILEKEEVQAQWKEGIIIKLPKKETLGTAATIMLLSTPGKVLNRVLLERMKEAVDPKLRDQILCRPDRQLAHHRGTVTGVELPPLHQLHRLWEDLRLCRQKYKVEAIETLWNAREDNLPHPVHLSGHELQDCPCRPAVGKFRGEDWSSVCFHSSSSSWSTTGPWRPPQQLETTVYSGHYGRS